MVGNVMWDPKGLWERTRTVWITPKECMDFRLLQGIDKFQEGDSNHSTAPLASVNLTGPAVRLPCMAAVL